MVHESSSEGSASLNPEAFLCALCVSVVEVLT